MTSTTSTISTTNTTSQFLGDPPDGQGGYNDDSWVGQMTTPYNLQQGGDSSQPTRSRVQFLQELKASRLEKVRLHRARGREAATPRPPAPLGSQRPLAPGAP